MINLRRLSWAGVLSLLFLISGCTGRPFLTQDNSYSIIKVSPEGEIQKTPIQLTWNSNYAVLQKLLLEASFVLSDLHTQSSPEDGSTDTPHSKNGSLRDKLSESTSLKSRTSLLKNQEPKKIEEPEETSEAVTEPSSETVLLEANFPQARRFNLMIDGEQFTLDISSVQIEVKGKDPGRVILNREVTLQGILNPNLIPSFDEFTEMLRKSKEKHASTAASL